MNISLYIIAVNIVTFAAYAIDKRAAQNDEWRVPEQSLFVLNLAGGVLGAWSAFFLLRHKTRHLSFWVVQTIASIGWLFLLLRSVI